MDLFEDEFIRDFKVRVVIGKGGMGKKTTEAMKRYGAVYGAFTGGAAVLAAKAIKNVKSVEWYDLGMPEALWILEVEDFITAIKFSTFKLYKTFDLIISVDCQDIYTEACRLATLLK